VRLRDGLARTVQHYRGLRNVDPNAWFTPRDVTPTPRIVTPPALPQEFEVADEDLLQEEKELDIQWAPVPAIPGLGR
jgi:hypothetical protein